MIPKIPNEPKKQISIGQRLLGVGTVALTAFVIVMCLSFIGPLKGGPRNAAIGVVVFSVIVMFFGVVVGFPDFLPKKIVAGTLFLFGIFSMLMGVTLLIWFGYNMFVQAQPGFRPGRIGIAIAMIAVGYGMTVNSWKKLRGTHED